MSFFIESCDRTSNTRLNKNWCEVDRTLHHAQIVTRKY